MAIEDLDIKNLYIGDKPVLKLYKGTDQLYPQQGGGIYDRDGKLYIPAGTKVDIEDYSSGEPTTIEYILPDTVEISGDSGEVTLSDSQRIRYNATYRDSSTIDNTIIEYVTPSRTTENITVSKNDYTRRNVGYPLKYTSKTSGIVRIPYAAFRVTSDIGASALHIYTTLNYYENKTYIKDIRLHDYGTEAPSLWLNPSELVSAQTDQLIDPNDQACQFFDYNIYIPSSSFVIKPNHYYVLYAIVDSSYNYYTAQNFGSDGIRTTRWYATSVNYTYHYDEPLYVTANGYDFGGDRDVNVSISYYSRPDNLGTTKLNEQLQYYDTVPSE